MSNKDNNIYSPKQRKKTERTYSNWFFFILLYLFVDFGRPQDLLPIGFLKPGMITILILTCYLFFTNSIKNSDSKQSRLILAFVLLTAAFIPFARNTFWAYITTKTMLLYMPFILSTIAVVNSASRLKKMMFIIIITMLYVSLYSLYHHGQGSGNYFKDENDLALYINTILPFCYFLFLYEKNWIKKSFYLFGMVVGILGVVNSFSRGGFLGFIAMTAVAWWFSPKKIVSLLIILMAAILIFYFGADLYKKEMATATDTEHGTGRARIESWKAAWAMFLDNPLGVGGNNFQVRFHEYQTEYFKRGMWGRVAHSLWFTLLSELGIAGVFIYFSLIYYNLKDIFHLKNLKEESKANRDVEYLYFLSFGFLASFAGYFASGTFLSVLYYPHYWYLTAVLAASSQIAYSYNNSQ
jgi:putative inorganic carbon (hco3(-)) transporter